MMFIYTNLSIFHIDFKVVGGYGAALAGCFYDVD
jgi:hypothetical protein